MYFFIVFAQSPTMITNFLCYNTTYKLQFLNPFWMEIFNFPKKYIQ